MPQLYRLTDTADAQLSTVNYQLSIGDDINALVANLAQRIYNGEKITYDPDLLRSTVKPYLDGITKGYGKSLADVDWDTPDFKTLQKLTENVFQFSASKDFNLLRDMTNALKGSDGKLRSFDEFRQEVDRMNAKYNVNWLRTEYNQAVAASQCAARWTDYGKRADKNPFLQYQAVMDANTRAEHAALNGVIKRYDDDFWDKYYPPNGWGCRCEVIQLPGKNHRETPDADLKYCKVDPMWKVNVGKKGVVFPKGHPYFINQCGTNSCPLKSRKLADGTLKEQCKGCLQGMGDCEKYVDRCKKKSEYANNIKTIKVREYEKGGKEIWYADKDAEKKADFATIKTIARNLAKEGNVVEVMPRWHCKSDEYKHFYSDLIGTKYENKCPDLRINGKFYEFEGFVKPWTKDKIGRMLSHGLKQSSRIIIDNTKGCSHRYLRKRILRYIEMGAKIDEVLIYEKGILTPIYKKSGKR